MSRFDQFQKANPTLTDPLPYSVWLRYKLWQFMAEHPAWVDHWERHSTSHYNYPEAERAFTMKYGNEFDRWLDTHALDPITRTTPPKQKKFRNETK